MLNIPLSPEKEAKLRERAAAAGKDVTEYILDVVDENLAMTEPMAPRDTDSPQRRRQWEMDLDAWAAGHPHRSILADDDREGIYAGRGE